MYTVGNFKFDDDDLGGAAVTACGKLQSNKIGLLTAWLKKNYSTEYASVASEIEANFSITYITDQIESQNKGQQFLDKLQIFVQSL